MRVIIRRKAADDLDDIYTWISSDNPRAARDMVLRVHDRITQLEVEALTHMGVRAELKARGNL
jgi:plasmid stabilization system protein ParE